MKKVKDFIKKNYIACTVVGALLLVIIASIIIISILNINKNKIELKEKDMNMYQYFADVKKEFNAKLSYENDSLVNIDSKEYLIYENSPIYGQDKKIIIIPKVSSIVFYYRQNLSYQLPKYSSLSDNDGVTEIKSNGKKEASNNFFVYDGADTYLFPNQSTLKVNGKSINLSKYSYVIASNNYVTYYDYESDTVKTFEDNIKSATITIKDINIDLLKDVTVANYQVGLLNTKVNNLDIYLED